MTKLLESVQKYVINKGVFNETLLVSRNVPPRIVDACLFTAMGLRCLSVQTLKKPERMELLWANNGYNTEFSVETRVEHGFAMET